MDAGQVTSSELWAVPTDKLDDWIAKVLLPSPDFTRQVKETVNQICEFLKNTCFGTNIRVLKTVKGGSSGKGTALRNNSDADVVLFLNCFSSYEDQKKDRIHILDFIKKRLHACRDSLTFTVNIDKPRYKGPHNMPRSLSLTLTSRRTQESIEVDIEESIEVDILPAYDALGQVIWGNPPDVKVYEKLLNTRCDPGEFSPCFTELQKNFVKRHPAKLKNLLRLVKHWYKEMLKPQYPSADLPPKYALELLTIYAWQEGAGSRECFDMSEGFRTVLELLRRPREICVYWETNYSLQDSQIGAHVKSLLRRPRPVILDPADPTGILGQGKNWDLVARAATDHLSLPCVRSAKPWDVQPARLVEIEVKQLTGTSLVRTLSPSTTIQRLKEEIEQVWGIPWYRQRLKQRDPSGDAPILQNDETLAAHGIFYSTVLIVVQTESQEMEVFVKNDKGRSTTYMVRPSDTVRQLKERIHSQQGPPADQQNLMYESEIMKDQHTLAHYKVQPRSTIYMLLRLRGGRRPLKPPVP
ncbi:2'-5'-oligoadenylate synthase 1-like [Phaenicophaeus curvirostris]|uniref:2'-5'-oligoadenylate synthase 1-like n=1 Tax=Phaenicophaeus curvirostris TaxID=33595 RepID=UPI0037F0E954